MRYASTGLGISSIERHGMSGAIASSPTAEMRKQLAAQSIPIPSATELVSYSQKMNTWINDWRREQNKEPSHSWFNLFKEVDNDGSGFVTFDELVTCVRRELKKGPDVISQNELMALWCAIDDDTNEQLHKDEVRELPKHPEY